MKKKKKENTLNWNLINNKMIEVVERILQKKRGIPIILDVYEFSGKLPIKNEKNFDGFVSFFTINKNKYIDYIAIRKYKSKEYKTFVLAHELGHILDYLQNNFIDSLNYKKLNEKKKLQVFEREKRAFSNGYNLLKLAGIPTNYLEKFIEDRSNCLGRLIYTIENKKSKKNSKKLCGFVNILCII